MCGQQTELCLHGQKSKILMDFAQVIVNHLRSRAICCRETAQGRTLDFIFGINALSRQNHGLQEYYQKVLNRYRLYANADSAIWPSCPARRTVI